MNAKINPGTILISKPFIEDRRFDKSIILIVEHNKNGTIGFILNKQSPFQISDFSKDITNKNISIKIGGPVEKNNLFYIHKHPEIINDSFEIKNGYHWGGNVNNLIEGLNRNLISCDNVFFFTGYAGWEKNQLNEELDSGSWIVIEKNINISNDLKWSDLLVGFNKEFKVWANAPSDFRLN